ncbi:MAG: pilus assembly protein [Planctomycetota bacterium]|nr:pilus assembly protein [Planctomycetota bacterium]MDA1210969.1 pilus assembly protein [Planctomycetota bacterium]
MQKHRLRSRERLGVRCLHRRRGAAIVEFAIMAPVFLLLLMGSIESGKALEISNILSSAIRQGGRLACMDWEGFSSSQQSSNLKVESDIRNFLIASGIDGDDVEITITSADGDDSGDTFDLSNPANRLRMFRITATVAFDDVNNYPIPVKFMNGKNVSMSIVFRAGNSSMSN